MVLPKMARFGRTPRRVQASTYVRRSGAANAGIHTGDWLLSINGEPVKQALDVTRILVRVGHMDQS